MQEHGKKILFHEPGLELSPDTGLLVPPPWISQPLDLWGIHVCCLNHQFYDIFVIAALDN